MYPSEETTRRNRWQDEYDAATREHAWTHEDMETARLYRDLDDASDIPADVRAQFESE